MTFIKEAQQAIRTAGGRMTDQRRLIIDFLATSPERLDAEGLYLKIKEQEDTISLATVYRTLNVLEEAGLIFPHYVSRDHERKFYELAHVEEEYHFTCRSCGKVIPFRSELIQELKTKLETELGVDVLNACACFNGYCANCRSEN